MASIMSALELFGYLPMLTFLYGVYMPLARVADEFNGGDDTGHEYVTLLERRGVGNKP